MPLPIAYPLHALSPPPSRLIRRRAARAAPETCADYTPAWRVIICVDILPALKGEDSYRVQTEV
ncbi:hypothetical protein KB20921_09220 [Edwardsiella ictaluri]|nr:hypothetical protein KB20921_09220 [Edwardsiella ictaluri]BEI05130.1 hypothetical protein KH201010_09160 [Edwardsiella ictaluri]BEI08586.1 hypothetical protein STU22726_09170 [Edwardsiella ictaluri]BEI12069.1 hypothetical protein STU22816_09220 [Edwardsiella ictaluri]BEI15544.1 hypothetical protein STA22820_09170 [Edwardsiella ictaluri]